ncbi:MAG: hypothetical protein BJ554DRAFT_3857, partial [Olpidium bornovanus]
MALRPELPTAITAATRAVNEYRNVADTWWSDNARKGLQVKIEVRDLVVGMVNFLNTSHAQILFQVLEGVTLPLALEALLADREGLQAWAEAPVGWPPEHPVWASLGALLGHHAECLPGTPPSANCVALEGLMNLGPGRRIR